MNEMNGTSEMPAPKVGDRMAVKCRRHWHVGVVYDGPTWDDDDDGLNYYEVFGNPLTLEAATDLVLRGW